MELAQVMEENPTLTIGGFETPGRASFAKARADLAAAGDQFERARDWLRLTGRVNEPRWSSYFLKHIAEGWAGNYIANGAMIAAALALGFPVKRWPNQNPQIGVSGQSKWPKRLRVDR